MALRNAHLEEVLQTGGVASRLPGEAARLRWLETSLLVGRDELVLELAQAAAQLRLEVGPADPPQIAHQLLARDQSIDRRVDQGVVADVVELRLHLLAVVRGHER